MHGASKGQMTLERTSAERKTFQREPVGGSRGFQDRSLRGCWSRMIGSVPLSSSQSAMERPRALLIKHLYCQRRMALYGKSVAVPGVQPGVFSKTHCDS
eukprot:3932719-Rhodomonas_salina.1